MATATKMLLSPPLPSATAATLQSQTNIKNHSFTLFNTITSKNSTSNRRRPPLMAKTTTVAGADESLTHIKKISFFNDTALKISPTHRRRPLLMAKNTTGGDGESTTTTTTEKIAILGGLISNPVIAWSLYTLKTTGCGLPPGPGGSIGGLEGVSYLAVVGIIGWSLYTKAKTGSGLPNGPYGLLGAVEGLSYLSLVGILVVFGLQLVQNGSIPGPLPSDQCFG
ncbi:hypothetical protein ACFE04_001558 [Oxalis oulophora]